MRKFTMFLLISSLLWACVPAKMLEETKVERDQALAENSELKEKLRKLEEECTETRSQLAVMTKEHNDLVKDTTEFGITFRQIRTQYDKLNELNDILASKNGKLMQDAAEENKKLLEELGATRLELQSKEDQLDQKEASLNALNAELEARSARLEELETMLQKQEGAMSELKNRVASALLGFADKGLTVVQKNGKVYVSLEAKLLFPSGSTVIDPEGKRALIDLAKAIEDQKDLEIIVEGHTDTDALKSDKHPKDNWELSVLRATAVVDIMTKNSSIDPRQLSAAGRSEFLPVDVNNKAKNRRIEIILSPNLNELFQVIEN